MLYIFLNSNSFPVRVRVVDISGRVISDQMTYENTFSFKGFSSSIYFVSIILKNKVIYSSKIISL
jgi:hypothetical protein